MTTKKLYLPLAALLVGGILAFVGLTAPTAPTQADGQIPDQYIVVLRDSVANPGGVADELASAHGLTLGQKYSHALKGFAAHVPAGRLAALEKDPRVAFVSADRVINVLGKGGSSGKPGNSTPPPPQVVPTGVARLQAAGLANRGAGVNVAVIDTGIDLTHPDLAANIVGGKNCLSGHSYADGNGHGTHVSGTIAALDNSQGVVGIAPQAKLWSVRVLDNNGSGSWSSVICGIDFVTSEAPANGGPITLANMSLGGAGTSDNNCGNTNNDALHQALCRSRDAGVTYVVAAGNDGADASLSVPAAYDDAVITVSALADSDGAAGGLGAATSYGADDTFASFSNYGSVVDLAAPGVNIYSTYKGGTYATMSGTSMATPHVTGAAALYLAAHPGATWTQVRDGLKALAEPLGSGHTDPSGRHPEAVVQANAL